MKKNEKNDGETIILPRTGWFDIHLGEIWNYRDLISINRCSGKNNPLVLREKGLAGDQCEIGFIIKKRTENVVGGAIL